MARRRLANLTFIGDGFTKSFSVCGYTFYPRVKNTRQHPLNRIITARQILRDNIQHRQNAYVEYTGKQESSVIFRGRRVGVSQRLSREHKFLEDILVLGSLLTARNWQLFSRRDFPQYPVVSRNHLEYISKDAEQCRQDLEKAISKLKDKSWQKQFENGFHLVMLLSSANILNAESRFLSMVVIWEWLYPHLKNPNGATSSDESNKLLEIFSFILKKVWPQDFNSSLESSNIFHVLRNQLAHSGKLPINRTYADRWMKQMQWEHRNTIKGVKDYLNFFDRLTQIVVLKTLGINGEDRLKVFNFPDNLKFFLKNGKI